MNDDTIFRQAAIDTLRNINAIVSPISDDVLLIDKAEAMTKLMLLPPAQPEVRTQMSSADCISRQEAIEAIDAVFPVDPMKSEYAQGIACGAALAKTYVEQLPSAQPETCEDAVSRNAIIQKLNTMDRYVSEELILCDTDKKFPKNEVFIVDDVYEEIVENLPSAQPETAKRIVGKSRNGMTLWYQCDMCNEPVDAQDNFCRGCGRRLTDG